MWSNGDKSVILTRLNMLIFGGEESLADQSRQGRALTDASLRRLRPACRRGRQTERPFAEAQGDCSQLRDPSPRLWRGSG